MTQWMPLQNSTVKWSLTAYPGEFPGVSAISSKKYEEMKTSQRSYSVSPLAKEMTSSKQSSTAFRWPTVTVQNFALDTVHLVSVVPGQLGSSCNVPGVEWEQTLDCNRKVHEINGNKITIMSKSQLLTVEWRTLPKEIADRACPQTHSGQTGLVSSYAVGTNTTTGSVPCIK